MSKISWGVFLGLAGLVATTLSARAQSRPYIAYVYPAGGQQGATFEIKVAGQNLVGVTDVLVSGSGVTAKVVESFFPIGNSSDRLLSRQLADLKQAQAKATSKKKKKGAMEEPVPAASTNDPDPTIMIAKITKMLYEDVRFPACASFQGIYYIEVSIASNAPPGERELRLVTLRGGASNPMVFHVGQVPEHSRQPMRTAGRQVLGREQQSLRNRPASEAEVRVNIPCTVNGQIASREVNSYRFTARKGQRLVITSQARQLIPYIADGVPGWFQPVLELYDAQGKEVAYDDDYRFKPDPVILFEVPADGEYVCAIRDAIYRGRNDFIYRLTIGEQPFVTSIFPLGARVGEPVAIKMKGWNLEGAELAPPAKDAGAGVYQVVANREGAVSNPMPFALDTLPETLEKESNDTPSRAQKVTLPVMINGRIDKPDDWDVFRFQGKSNETVVAEVYARRLESPLDSVLKLTDADGKLVAFNDDCEDLASMLNTHHADSYFMAKLPADGTYYVHLGDTTRHGGTEYAYRLRISAPRPDFALRVVPSSASVASRGETSLSIHAIRRDGFTGDIKLELKNPPAGFTSLPVTLTQSQIVAKIKIKANLVASQEFVNLSIAGSTKIDDSVLVREVVPAEDRMQAFLWRHLVPAQELKVYVHNPKYTPPGPPLRVPPELTPAQLAKAEAVVAAAETKGAKFKKSQVEGLARGIKVLYGKGLLTDKFYGDRIAELGYAR
ncbi:MAG: hypothetical protein NTY53_15915 [Kiritimatiellaeota bacterium]|nr:hypothetical protein [Kiritimatiellota bacterium]